MKEHMLFSLLPVLQDAAKGLQFELRMGDCIIQRTAAGDIYA